MPLHDIMAIQLEIHSPSKTLLTGQADEVVAPSVSGEIGVLPQHTDYLTALGPGKLTVGQAGSKKDFEITGGLLEITRDKMTILVDE